jgi:hypothetical protein
MPMTTTSRTQKRRATIELDAHAAELEALGLGIAPGLPGDDRSEFVERAEIGAGQPRRDPQPVTPRRSRPRSSMTPSSGRRAAVGSGKLWGCRLIGGSATR